MPGFQSDQIDPYVHEVEGHIVELPEGVGTLHEGPNQQTVKWSEVCENQIQKNTINAH